MDCDSLAVPVRLAFASGGSGTILQMQGELLQRQGGVRFIHVPYKGDTPALAVTSAARLKALPDVPTMAEAGMVGGTPQQLGELQKSDSAKWAQLIREAGIKAD